MALDHESTPTLCSFFCWQRRCWPMTFLNFERHKPHSIKESFSASNTNISAETYSEMADYASQTEYTRIAVKPHFQGTRAGGSRDGLGLAIYPSKCLLRCVSSFSSFTSVGRDPREYGSSTSSDVCEFDQRSFTLIDISVRLWL